MAIPVYMQQFKSAGIYRIIFDRSAVLNQDVATLRLLVGYSPKGPFNVPVYVKSVAEFRELFGEGTKTLEKRGCYFHRMAEQCLADSPILVLNLKKFANEKVNASTIDTNFNVKNPIDTIEVPVEDIYDTTRFWTLSADKLNEIRGAEYINIATTNTKQTSGTYFIRKASGPKVSAYRITVADWYKATNEDIPEFLQGYETSLMSDFMAEIYVFGGRFVAEQVLASDNLKKYFELDSKGKLKLRQYVIDSFGDYVDTLDELYQEETSGAIGHYVGSLIPYFQDKQGNYAALDILFNQDQNVHNMMMAFNTDMLYEDGTANIDLSGARYISTVDPNDNAHDSHNLANDNKAYGSRVVCIQDIFDGTAKTSLLSNINAPVVADIIKFNPSIFKGQDENGKGIVKNELKYKGTKKVSGTLYVNEVEGNTIKLKQVAGEPTAPATYYENSTDDTVAEKTTEIEDKKQEIDAVKENIKTTEGQIKEINAKLADENTSEEDKDNLRLDVERLEENLGNYNNDLSRLSTDLKNLNTDLENIKASIKYDEDLEAFNKGITVLVAENGDVNKVLYQLGAGYRVIDDNNNPVYYAYKDFTFGSGVEQITGDGLGTYFKGEAYDKFDSLEGPKKVITSLNRDLDAEDNVIKLSGDVVKCTVEDVYIVTSSEYCAPAPVETEEGPKNVDSVLVNFDDPTSTWAVYGSSISFIGVDKDSWTLTNDSTKYTDPEDEVHTYSLFAPANTNSSLSAVISKGDRFLAEDGAVDMDGDDKYYPEDEDDKPNGYYDVVAVQDVETVTDKNGVPLYHRIKFTGKPMLFDANDGLIKHSSVEVKDKIPEYAQEAMFGARQQDSATYLVRIDRPLNQEIGNLYPTYLEGYTYENPKPNGTGMMAKLDWQNFMLDALVEYKGLRTALLNKSEIDYRYIIDTFESYVDSSLKAPLCGLAKAKESAFAILNFPSVRTFVKCPYTSFTNEKGVFNAQYVVDGKNKKKAAVKGFGLPSDAEGASYCAFYTPLKFSDGYVDSIIPSAGIVSNLYMEKYRSRQPYYIIAGPNYGAISASGLVGPDYNYSRDELNILEPYGVNCMVYRPGFGTFINANQTAKQTPKSALSSINVRELVIYIMDEVERVLQAYQWEFNNPQTRNSIKDRADAICARVQANGGIQAYLNVMDESNNTPDIIDNEMAVLSTHIEPGRGMGKMIHELTLYRTGGMKSAIVQE